MKRFLIGIIFVFLVIVSGCRQPVGVLTQAGGSGAAYDFLLLRPNRILYEVNAGAGDGIFDRQADLRVFVADSGGFRPLNPGDGGLLLEVIYNPGLASQVITPIGTHFPFSEAGRYVIRGTYDDKIDEYSIEVRGDYVNPGDGGDFFDFIWL